MVNDQLECGKQLIEELVKEGYDLTVAFWARPIEEEKWFLYISSTVVNDKGIAMAYKIVYDAVSRMPELGFDIFDIKVLAADDVMAQAALGIIRAEVLNGHSAGKSAKPYVGITRFRGNSLGGNQVEGAFIYPNANPGSR